MRSYQYRCNDYSLLTPPFKKWIISPLLAFVPWAIPANIITLVSNLFVYLGLYFVLNPTFLGPFSPLAVAGCLFIYLVGDHLDGMQAKRTSTGSALGEFCDHYLDAFNNGIVVFTMLTFFGVTNPLIVAGTITLSYIAHAAVFYEQFRTGWLRFEPVGSLEGVLMTALLIGVSSFAGFYSFMTKPLVAGLTAAEWVILASAGGAILTLIQTLLRIPVITFSYWLFTMLLIVTATLSIIFLHPVEIFTVLTLAASLYVGRVMYGHLIDGEEAAPDWVVPISMFGYLVVSSNGSAYLYWLIVLYLVARILMLVVRTVYALRTFWVWQNARI